MDAGEYFMDITLIIQKGSVRKVRNETDAGRRFEVN
jgi:hypothetical protein